jgi:hypothetical protein
MPAERHTADREDWRCVVDGLEWPCPVAQAELVEAYHGDPAGMARHLGACYVRALDVLEDVDRTDLLLRMMGWIPRRGDVASRARTLWSTSWPPRSAGQSPAVMP